jgi:hypothetical protein
MSNEKRTYREVQMYDPERKALDFKENLDRGFQIQAAFNFNNHRGKGSRECVGFSKIRYGHALTPHLKEKLMQEAAHSAYVNAGLNGDSSEDVDYEYNRDVEPLWEKIIIIRYETPSHGGAKPTPIPQPAYRQQKATGLKVARNGRRYIPLQKKGLNYAWRDVKTGIVYSNGTYVRILNKEGADQSRAKPMRQKK